MIPAMRMLVVLLLLQAAAATKEPSGSSPAPPLASRASARQAQQVPSPQSAQTKVDIVSVTGCLKEATPNTWTLTNATDPVPSSANAPPIAEVPKTAPLPGKNQFRLIGVSEFNLPQHRNQTVIIKGLLIKASPVSRLNMTSVTTVAASCPAAP
jgi:hypothetical protein